MSRSKKKPFPFSYGNRMVMETGIDVNQEEDEPLNTINRKFLELFDSMGYDTDTIQIDWRDPQTVWFHHGAVEK